MDVERPAAPFPASSHPGFTPVDDSTLDALSQGVRLLALRKLGDGDAAADVVQETLARTLAALNAGRVADPARIGAYVRSVATHVIADVLRARRREGPPPTAEPASGVPDALQAIVRAEDVAGVRAALACLSPGDRDVLRLTFFEGMEAAAIALRCGVPAARVRKQKSRALERLRAAWSRLRSQRDRETTAAVASPMPPSRVLSGTEGFGG